MGAGLTRAQAEKRLRELMGAIQVTTDPDRTVRSAGQALLAHLERRELELRSAPRIGRGIES